MLIKEVAELPEELPLLPFAEEELKRHTPVERKIFLRRSKHTWVLFDDVGEMLMVVGVTRPTQLSTPEVWMLLCEGFTKNLRRNLIAVRKKVQDLLDLYPHVRVRVDALIPGGTKFVEFMGFTEYFRDTKGTREYIYYEVRR
jgi:hypothetical protein